jgi:chromosome segregation ATPase
VEKSEKLRNELIKCRFDSKIAIEKEVFQLREENNQYLAQIETLNNQLIAIKNDFNSLQLIRLNLEQQLSHNEDNYRNDKFFINNMSSQIIQINNKIQSVAQYISSVESLHNELKNSGIFRFNSLQNLFL